MDPRPWSLVVVPALAALAVHGFALVRDGVRWSWPPPFHAGLAALAAAAIALWCAPGRFRARAVAGLAASASLWPALAYLALRIGPLHARGTLWLAFGFLSHLLAVAWVSWGGAARPLSRIALGAVAVAACLASIETVTRMFVPVQLYDLVPDDPGAGPAFERKDGMLAGRPGFKGRYMHPEFPGIRVELNGRGFRDGLDEPDPPRPPWILVLGDSFAFGCGVRLEDTFHERLERKLADLEPAPQVLCAALPGFGQVQERKQLEALLAEGLRPNLVIATVYEGNDFEDNARAGARDLGLVPDRDPEDYSPPEDVLQRYLRNLGRSSYWLGSSVAVQVALPRVEELLVGWGWLRPRVATNRYLSYTMVREPPEAIRVAMHWTRLVVRGIRDLCGGHGADLLVLVIPAAIQADPVRYAQFLDRVTPRDRYAFDRLSTHKDFVGRLAEDGLEVIDCLPALEASARAGTQTYHREGHWNEKGHAIAADLLEPHVRQRLR